MARRTAAAPIATAVPRDTDLPIATGTVRLTDDPDGSTTVWVNDVPSSSMRADPEVLDFEYMRHFAAAIRAWGPPERMLALHVGAGVCTMARHLSHAYPDSRHIAVDVDATLPELARSWWDLPRSPQLRVRAQDGLAAVAERHDDSLDLILRDAFACDATPPTLADEAWWGHARRVLRPGGLVVANVKTVPGHATHRPDALAARSVFPGVVAVGEGAVLKGRRRGNAVLVAGDSVDVAALRRYAASAPLPTSVTPDWPS
ncbi:spermidine synthase [Demequina sp. NBRC 110056]|uniref:spermidine synthase n=1 Tax=Demequina sp. NBRC 110056 TaxID=1570345 RepID=UPI000A006F7C|nr:fused MFS/spermidine synthase [Demequina sp. NBRC 110056]